MCFLKLQDHYKINFMPKNDLVISQAYAPNLFGKRRLKHDCQQALSYWHSIVFGSQNNECHFEAAAKKYFNISCYVISVQLQISQAAFFPFNMFPCWDQNFWSIFFLIISSNYPSNSNRQFTAKKAKSMVSSNFRVLR